ncbi:DNA cytosine methyltransferase [Bradyrhizobium sp. LB13.1]
MAEFGGRRQRAGSGSQKRLRAGALFCGIGGFCSGFEAAGFETLWANELDPYACEVYRTNYPHIRLIEKDVRKLSVVKDKLKPVDVLHAGFPCQSFSQAGARAGFDDERGKLFFEIIRLVKEFGKDKPRAIVLENAPFLTMGEGGVWILEITRQLQRAGYWFRESSNSKLLDLFDLTEVPQKRARLFMVAWSVDHFSNGRFEFPDLGKPPKKDASKFIDFDSEKPDGYYLPTDNRYYKMISKEKVDTETQKHVYQLRKYFVRQKEPGVCPTLTANMGHGGHNVPFIWDRRGLRKLTELECLKLQGFPNSFVFPEQISRAQRYAQIGNAVAPPVAELLARAVRTKIVKET